MIVKICNISRNRCKRITFLLLFICFSHCDFIIFERNVEFKSLFLKKLSFVHTWTKVNIWNLFKRGNMARCYLDLFSSPKTFATISKRFKKAEMCFLRQQRSQTDALVIVGWVTYFHPLWNFTGARVALQRHIFWSRLSKGREKRKKTSFWGQKWAKKNAFLRLTSCNNSILLGSF